MYCPSATGQAQYLGLRRGGWIFLEHVGDRKRYKSHLWMKPSICESELQYLALKTYALRPCWLRGAVAVMPAEMRSVNAAAHDHFNEIGQAARRSSAIVLRKLAVTPVDEHQVIPSCDVEGTRAVYLTIEHSLHYMFYHEGQRRAPQGVDMPEFLIATLAVVARPVRSGPQTTCPPAQERLEQLYDSDDDLVLCEEEQEEWPLPMREKRKQNSPAAQDGQDSSDARLLALRRLLEDDPVMVKDIDQMIAFRQASLAKGSPSTLISAPTSEFRSSQQQGTVHDAILTVSTHYSMHKCSFLQCNRTPKKMMYCHTLQSLVKFTDGTLDIAVSQQCISYLWK